MSAPIGNKNAKKYWFKPLSEKEKSVRVQSNIPISQRERMKVKCAEKGIKITDAIREAIAIWLNAQENDG